MKICIRSCYALLHFVISVLCVFNSSFFFECSAGTGEIVRFIFTELKISVKNITYDLAVNFIVSSSKVRHNFQSDNVVKIWSCISFPRNTRAYSWRLSMSRSQWRPWVTPTTTSKEAVIRTWSGKPLWNPISALFLLEEMSKPLIPASRKFDEVSIQCDALCGDVPDLKYIIK